MTNPQTLPLIESFECAVIERSRTSSGDLTNWLPACQSVDEARNALVDLFAACDAEIAALKKQLETLQHNYRVSFDREEQLNEELNDLTMAIVQLFSPATARRIYSARAALGGNPSPLEATHEPGG